MIATNLNTAIIIIMVRNKSIIGALEKGLSPLAFLIAKHEHDFQ